MNAKRHLIISGLVLNGLILCLVPGCAASKNRTGLSSKESRMSEELLRSQVLRYKAQAEIEMARIKPIFDQFAPMDSPFTPEASASIAAEFALMAPDNEPGGIQDYGQSLYMYYLFYEKLKEKGGDMTGLEIDFDCLLQDQYYSPPADDMPSPPEIQANANEPFQNL